MSSGKLSVSTCVESKSHLVSKKALLTISTWSRYYKISYYLSHHIERKEFVQSTNKVIAPRQQTKFVEPTINLLTEQFFSFTQQTKWLLYANWQNLLNQLGICRLNKFFSSVDCTLWYLCELWIGNKCQKIIIIIRIQLLNKN